MHRPECSRVPIRAGRAVPSPIGYGIMLRRATPIGDELAQFAAYCTGNGTSPVVSELRC